MSALITRDELIAEARGLGDDVKNLLDALNTIWGHGFSDESSGTVEAPCGHFFRVEHWIVTTDSQGFHNVETYDTIEDAMSEFLHRDQEYAAWLDDEMEED